MTHFAALTVSGLLLVGFGSIWASDRAGHREALNEARSITKASLRTVVAPNLTHQVVSGHPAALADFDDDVREHLLDDSIVRVKIWHPDGTVIYSDAMALIGERHTIERHRLESLERAVVVADHGDLADPENRFEVGLGPLLEVYLPFEGPTSTPLLLELYFTDASVNASASRIRRSVLPIIMSSLAAVGSLTLLLANHLQRRLDRSARERELLLRRSVDASAIERRRIAADLHDGVVQELSGTLMLMSAAEARSDDDSESATRIRQATAGLRQSLRSLRAVALDIHPPNLDDVGLRVALDDLVESFTQRHNFTVDLTMGPGDFAHQRLIYRFVQEGLRNVAKHAHATAVEVTVVHRDEQVVVSVLDNGHGLDNNGVDDGHRLDDGHHLDGHGPDGQGRDGQGLDDGRRLDDGHDPDGQGRDGQGRDGDTQTSRGAGTAEPDEESGGMGIALLRGLAADVDGQVTFKPSDTGGSILELVLPR